ncbi:MAG: DUF4922 domain-containing protein [Nitrospirota bacterium]
MKSEIALKKKNLWHEIRRKTEIALQRGALLPIPTDYEFIEECGVRFIVRILASLGLKDEVREKERRDAKSGILLSPFFPYDENLFVADISKTHIALLNKFNVMEYHLLIVTRVFEDQETLLTLQDFEALWACMAQYKALAFYNGGEAAGASQRHKHLQMVPLPLAPVGPEVPIEPLLSGVRFENGIGLIPAFPFLHAFALIRADISSPLKVAKETSDLYLAMLNKIGLKPTGAKSLKKQSAPYCLLLTRKWMLLVPRSREFFDSISINSLGFAGAFLVRNRTQMNLLKKRGPMAALKHVSIC